MQRLIVIVIVILIFIFTIIQISADETLRNEQPWFSGPLLNSSAFNAPVGMSSIQSYYFHGVIYQTPHFLIDNQLIEISSGLFKHVDMLLGLPYFEQYHNGASASGLGDAYISFGLQAVSTKKNDPMPNIRFILSETFPNGKFNKLNPKKYFTDAFGQGIYQTSITAVIEQLYYICGEHYLDVDLSLSYTLFGSAHVSGFSYYGGNIKSNGIIHVGPQFAADLSLQYSLTKHWATSIDLLYVTQQGTQFNNLGTETGPPRFANAAGIGYLDYSYFSLAPALQYNFNASVGIIAGVWFSVKIENRAPFVFDVITLEYSF